MTSVSHQAARRYRPIVCVMMWRQLKNYVWLRVMLVGDYPYYQRFGFSKLENVIMPPPTNPDRVLGRALIDGAWDGVNGAVKKRTGTLLDP